MTRRKKLAVRGSDAKGGRDAIFHMLTRSDEVSLAATRRSPAFESGA